MSDEQHPADSLLETIRDTFTGEGFKQTLRNAWDRLHGTTAAPEQSSHDKAVADMNAQANAQRTAAATQSFIKPDQAAQIRKKAAK